MSIRLVGTFLVCRHGSPLSATDVGSRKARTLLALLAVEPGQLLPTDRIIGVLWGGAPPKRPEENVATLVSRVRTALGTDTIVGGRGGYRLGPAVGVDLTEADRLVTAAENEPSASAALAGARQALRLLDGEVLIEAATAGWPLPARYVHAELLRRARHTAAEAALRTDAPQLAAGLAQAAVDADPFDETGCRALMRAQLAAGEVARALLAYERLRTTLSEELGADPSPATRELHQAILRL
ncbi:AfsR/SARP family transcriptional regulator [Flindersiella endophytica]